MGKAHLQMGETHPPANGLETRGGPNKKESRRETKTLTLDKKFDQKLLWIRLKTPAKVSEDIF